jgi:hypothetical protein
MITYMAQRESYPAQQRGNVMPKFYVFDGAERTVIEADHPLQACFRAIKHRFEGVPVNGFYRISEQGFEDHENDTVFSSDEVIHALLELLNREKKNKKNPKKDEDEG